MSAPPTEEPSKGRRRHVLLVAPQPFYQDRGTPIALRHVVRALSEQGWHVDVLTYPLGEDLDLPRVRIFRFAKWIRFETIPIGMSLKKLLLDAVMIFAIWSRVRKESYACIHAVEEAVYPALLITRINRLPVIYDMQSSLAEQLAASSWYRFFVPKAFSAWCERMACRKAALVVCSVGLAQKIKENGCSVLAREWVFPREWVDMEQSGRATIRQELNLPDSARVVIYAGNFEAYQGISLLLASVPLVIRECPDAVFLLIGADEASLRAISSRHKDLLQQGHLILRNRQVRSRTLELLHVADVAVSPRARGANLPLKVFDYLVAGLPVVATDIEAHRSLDGKGLMLTRPTPECFAEGIIRLLKDSRLAKRYRTEARDVTDTELGWPVFCRQVTSIYRDALKMDEDAALNV